MEKKHIFLIIVAIVVVAGAGLWLMTTFSESKPTEPTTTTPNQPTTVDQSSGNLNCEDMYNEIENDLDRANYCQVDTDCKVIMLGGWYMQFGCHHFINKNEDERQFYDKMDVYNERCSRIINKCAPAPDTKCVSNKCIYAE